MIVFDSASFERLKSKRDALGNGAAVKDEARVRKYNPNHDEQGRFAAAASSPIKVYRGSGEGSSTSNVLTWATPDEKLASKYANARTGGVVLEFDLDPGKSFDVGKDSMAVTPSMFAVKVLTQARDEGRITNQEAASLRREFMDGQDAKDAKVHQLWATEEGKQKVAALLKKAGFDSLKIEEEGVVTYGFLGNVVGKTSVLVGKADDPPPPEPGWNRPELAIDPATGKKRRILQPFDSFMDDNGEAIISIASSLHTSRVSAYGFTAEAAALGLEEYQITEQLDTRACPLCKQMHGKVFKVKDARALLDIVCRVTDPADLKSLQPWPKQNKASREAIFAMSDKELVAAGYHIPPLHPYCRGLLTKVGDAPPMADDGSTTRAPPKPDTTPEDFSTLGIPATVEQARQWDSLSGLSPAEVLARLKGLAIDDLLAEAVEDKASVGAVVSFPKESVLVAVDSKLPGSVDQVKQSFTLKSDSLVLNHLSVKPADQTTGVVAAALLAAYALASSLGKTKLALSANMEVGGYAWAKYGFKPSPSQWEALKKDIYAGSNKGAAWAALSPESKAAISTVLASNEAESIFFLADMTEEVSPGVPVGEALLAGTAWSGTLDLQDPEAVTRFLSYMGAA